MRERHMGTGMTDDKVWTCILWLWSIWLLAWNGRYHSALAT